MSTFMSNTLPVMNSFLHLIGLVVIPILIVFGILRPKTTPKEKLKDEIELEIHKALSINSNEFCINTHKVRDEIWKGKNRDKPITLKFVLLFDRALRELDIEKRVFIVYSSEALGASSYSYQSPHADRIKSYGIIGNRQLRFATIPTNANVNFFTEKREIG